MNKLLIFGMFGMVAANNATNATSAASTAGDSSSGSTSDAGGSEDGGVVDDTAFAGNRTGIAGATTFPLRSTLTLELPENVTSAAMIAVTIPAGDYGLDWTACSATPAPMGAAEVACNIRASMEAIFDAQDSGAKVGVAAITAGRRRRSLSEIDEKRILQTSANLKFDFMVKVSSVTAAGDLKRVVGGLTATEMGAQISTNLPTGVSYGTISATSPVFGKVCTSATACEDVVATEEPAATTTSDAIRTGLGLTAAVVAGVFLF